MPGTEEAKVTDGSQSNNDEQKVTETEVNTDDQKTEDQKTESVLDDKTDDTKVEDILNDDEKGADDGAPESYSDFNVPEGYEIEKEQLKEFHDLAKEFNLSQPKAQKFVDYQIKIEQQRRFQEVEIINGWAKEAKADANIMQNKAIAKQALNTAPEGIRNILSDLGITNNPEFLRWLIDIGKGKSIQEQPLINGASKKVSEKTGFDRII